MKGILFIIIAWAFVCTNAQWKEQSTGVTTPLYSISAVTDSVAWVCGEDGIVLHTNNGGNTWTQVGADSIIGTVPLYNIFGIDSANALVTGSSTSSSFLFRTTDAGKTWNKVFTQSGGFGDGIWMFDSLKGVFYGDPVGGHWGLWRTTDAGMTWDSTGLNINSPTSGEAGWNNAIWGTNDKVAFGTSGGRIYVSADTGKTWDTLTTPSQQNSYSIFFRDTTRMFVGGAELLQSTNQGKTFNMITTPAGNGNVVGIAASNNNIWFVRGGTTSVVDLNVYFSNDTGKTWSTAYTTPQLNQNEAYDNLTMSRNGKSIWAVRSGGSIIKFDSIATAINDAVPVPSEFSLEQNYPNPFNPSTTINYNLPKEEHVILKIYDVLGREVKTLVDEVKPAGKYQLQFNASDFASGVYLYKLRTDSYSDIKKMTLIK